jgi:hypothetical protein
MSNKRQVYRFPEAPSSFSPEEQRVWNALIRILDQKQQEDILDSAASIAGGGGGTTWTGLTDTPAAFATNAFNLTQVNATESALEFITKASLTAELDHDSLLNAAGLTNNHSAIDAHIADTALHAGGITDHEALTCIGTYIHASIDAHIDDTSIHFTLGSIGLSGLTDNAVVRANGSVAVQNTGWIIGDTDIMSAGGTLSMAGNALSNPLDPAAGTDVGDRDYNDGRYNVVTSVDAPTARYVGDMYYNTSASGTPSDLDNIDLIKYIAIRW